MEVLTLMEERAGCSMFAPSKDYTALVDHRHKNMPRRESSLQFEMVQGTLDMQVEHGSLYPALHRLDNRSWIASFWGTSENNRKAKYYRLAAEGRKQLASQTSRCQQVVRAIGRILNPATEHNE